MSEELRQIDAEIAEKVMKFVVETDPKELERLKGYGAIAGVWYRIGPQNWCPAEDVPRYSTDISAALQVVERFVWPAVVLMEYDRFYFDGKTQTGWRLTIRAPRRHDRFISASLPEAICRAALAATEGVEGINAAS